MPRETIRNFGEGRVKPACSDGFRVLTTTHQACKSFVVSFDQVRADRRARGASTDAEQDLLRAMLVFASSGLDAMIKQLVRDALPNVISAAAEGEGAAVNFKNYVERHLSRDQKAAARLISMSITSTSPRDSLVNWFLSELTSDSLQSADQIFQVASFFDISKDLIVRDVDSLKRIFRIRNQIIHEMDIDFTQTNRNRTPRPRDVMVQHANIILEVSENFLRQVDVRCE